MSRRLEATQVSTESGAQNGVMFLNIEGLNLQEHKPLGTGASAKVYEATRRGDVFAVKMFAEGTLNWLQRRHPLPLNFITPT